MFPAYVNYNLNLYMFNVMEFVLCMNYMHSNY